MDAPLERWLSVWKKKLNGNCTRMLRAILNKPWKQRPSKQQLYGHLPPISKTIQITRTRHAGHFWGSKDGLISDVLIWIPAHGRPSRTYLLQFSTDTRCGQDLPEVMVDRDGWRERVREICASSRTWWWWWYIRKCCKVLMLSRK